jgi:hypothetical protein
MELVERYLNDIGMYLPRAERADVLKELAANIRAEIDDRASELGRPLVEAEVREILGRHGHPMVLAAKFRGDGRALVLGRRWIGPELYPSYRLLLRINLSITLALYALILAVAVVRGKPFPYVATSARDGLLLAALQVLGVTLVFVAWDRFGPGRTARWVPRPLAPEAPARGASMVGLLVWAAVALWWMAIPSAPTLLFGPFADRLEIAPAWALFHRPVLALFLALSAVHAVTLFRPAWSRTLPAVRLALNAATLGLLYLVSHSRPWVLARPDAPQAQGLAEMLSAPSLLWWLWLCCGINFAAHALYFWRKGR